MYLQYNNITYLRSLPLCFFFVFFMELLFYYPPGRINPGAYQLTGARGSIRVCSFITYNYSLLSVINSCHQCVNGCPDNIGVMFQIAVNTDFCHEIASIIHTLTHFFYLKCLRMYRYHHMYCHL